MRMEGDCALSAQAVLRILDGTQAGLTEEEASGVSVRLVVRADGSWSVRTGLDAATKAVEARAAHGVLRTSMRSLELCQLAQVLVERVAGLRTAERLRRNVDYRAWLDRTPGGSPLLAVATRDPRARSSSQYRQTAALVYQLASALELRIERARTRWVVAPEAVSGRIVLEATGEERSVAELFLAKFIADQGLLDGEAAHTEGRDT